AIDAVKVEHGRSVYASRCPLCHGIVAVSGGAAPDLRASPVPLDTTAFASIVHDGALELRGMPRFPELAPDDLDAIRHYLRSRAREAGASRPAAEAKPQ